MRTLICALTLAGLLAGNLHAADKPLRALLILVLLVNRGVDAIHFEQKRQI